MYELKYLHQIHTKYAGEKVNVLSVFAINRQGLLDFLHNRNTSQVYQWLNNHLPYDTICHALMPECLGEDQDYRQKLGPKCNRVSRLYGVRGYPFTVIIDKNRVVRKVFGGFPMESSASELKTKEWMELIDQLLQE
jgi:hypothetical protein